MDINGIKIPHTGKLEKMNQSRETSLSDKEIDVAAGAHYLLKYINFLKRIALISSATTF